MKLCTFCYKSVSQNEHNYIQDNTELCSTFYRNLERFIKVTQPSFHLPCKVFCCRDCEFLVKEFCEGYHRMKVLELKLQWKLDSLINVMKLADRVPSRIKLVKQCFNQLENRIPLRNLNETEEHPEADNAVGLVTYEMFQNCRNELIRKCHLGRNISLLQPRILLQKLNDGEITNIRIEHLKDPTSPIAESNEAENYAVDLVDDDNSDVNGLEEKFQDIRCSLSCQSDNNKGDDENGTAPDVKYESSVFRKLDYENSSGSSSSSSSSTGSYEEPKVKQEAISDLNKICIPNTTSSILNKAVTFPCKFCSHKFTSEQLLKSHIKWRHRRLRENKSKQTFSFRCNICKTSYRTYQSLRQHKLSLTHRVLEKRLKKLNFDITNKCKDDLNVKVNEQLPDRLNRLVSQKLISTQELSKIQGTVETFLEEDKSPKYNLRVLKKQSYVSNSSSDENCSTHIHLRSSVSFEESDVENEKRSSSNSIKSTKEEKTDKISESQSSYRCFLDNCKFKRAVFYRLSSFNHHKQFHIRGKYQCKFCDKVENTIINLSLHETEMHSAIPSTSTAALNTDMFYCARCPFKNHKEGTYVNHFASTHLKINPPGISETLWECDICSRKFVQGKSRVKIHFKTHHDTSGLVDPDKHIQKCSEIGCTAYFLSKEQLRIHTKLKHVSIGEATNELQLFDDFIEKCSEGEFFKCSLCSKKSTNVWNFRKHMKLFHSESSVTQHDNDFNQLVKGNGIVCPIIQCTKIFQTIKGLEIHKKLHGTFPCIFCDEVLEYAPDLATHEQEVHSVSIKNEDINRKIRKIKCSRCTRFYKQQKSHKSHFVNEHLGISTVILVCSICKFQSHLESLTQHHLIHHYTDGMDPNLIQKCDQCSAYFRTKFQLKFHKTKIHRKILPVVSYKCIYCPKSFRVQTHLDRHLDKIHPETEISNQFKCSKCERLFVSEIGLKIHTTQNHSTKVSKRINSNKMELCVMDRCKRRFPNKKSLERHQKLHKRGTFPCHFCKKVFNTVLKLIQHETCTHSNKSKDKIQYCSRCPFETKYTIWLQKHFARVHIRTVLATRSSELNAKLLGNYKCEYCSLELPSASNLGYHEAEHANNLTSFEMDSSSKIQCPRCLKSYTKMFYIKHFLKVHCNGLTKRKHTVCSICQGKTTTPKKHFKKYHNTENLKDPSNIHKCEGKDEACKAYFLKYVHLLEHKRKMHYHLNDLACKICKKTYKTKASLKQHIKWKHSDVLENPELPFGCEVVNCKRRFDTKEELELHNKYSRHKNQAKNFVIKQLKCEKCDKSFPSYNKLQYHINAVHSDQSFVCPECGKAFKTKGAVKMHLIYHQSPDSWKFQCSICGKKSPTKFGLVTHMKTHTGEKPFICSLCGLKYAQKRNLRNHILLKHKGEMDLPTKRISVNTNRISRKGKKKGECIYTGMKP